MARQKFGGTWTEQKLQTVGAYLKQYLKVLKGKSGSYFQTTYVDAFAGPGRRELKPSATEDASLFNELEIEEVAEYAKGSVSIALELEPGFDHYLFIDDNAAHVTELVQRVAERFPEKKSKVRIVKGDANDVLIQWCKDTDWKKNRAVVFLDPFGMQVSWETIVALAKTKGVDLWLLVPLGQGINRLLTKKELPPEAWSNLLTRTFGTDEWKSEFYSTTVEATLFGDQEHIVKDADFKKIVAFFVKRLKTIFYGVVEEPMLLRNSTNNPLYLLCFAASNEKGAGPAMRIAKHLLSK